VYAPYVFFFATKELKSEKYGIIQSIDKRKGGGYVNYIS